MSEWFGLTNPCGRQGKDHRSRSTSDSYECLEESGEVMTPLNALFTSIRYESSYVKVEQTHHLPKGHRSLWLQRAETPALQRDHLSDPEVSLKGEA